MSIPFRKPVQSSCIRSIGYDAVDLLLEVEFTDGSVHQYTGVPEAIHFALTIADSIGRYFNENIRNVY